MMACPFGSNTTDTSPETRYLVDSTPLASCQCLPASVEYAACALSWKTATTCCGSLVLTAIAGSVKYPGSGVIETTEAFGAAGSCWALSKVVARSISADAVTQNRAVLDERPERLLPDSVRNAAPRVAWIFAMLSFPVLQLY